MILKIRAFKVNSFSFIIVKESRADLNFVSGLNYYERLDRSSGINLKTCF